MEKKMKLASILRAAVRGGASDIILKVGTKPRFRFQGNLVALADGEMVSEATMQTWLGEILPQTLTKTLKDRGDADFALSLSDGYRFRVNAFRCGTQTQLVLRVVQNHIKSLEELGMPDAVAGLANQRRGLLLVTGATGSGKSTTLAGAIQRINLTRACHIITIEDPIEFIVPEKMATISQREVGVDVPDFGVALRGALRQNPDVILVGELRDQETARTAIKAAETGHLVLSTLHTGDAAESMSRLLAFFPEEEHRLIRQTLAHNLVGIVSQRLVRRADQRGQVAAVEVLINTASVKRAIEEQQSFTVLHDLIAQGANYGMRNFDFSLHELATQGLISMDEALKHATNRANFELKLRGVGT
jgi:twitching motility protein PilT